jgi:hypothetical protein
VAPGDVLHVDVPGKGRHVGVAIDVGPGGEIVFAVATSGDWRSEPLRRVIDFSAEPARSWIRDWPRDNGLLSYFYGDFIDVVPPERWLRVVGRTPRAAVDPLHDLFFGWDSRRRGARVPPGPTSIPP